MPKHNNMIPDGHFHKNWQERVKTWFDQAARKKRRRTARLAKAARIAPRPIKGPLRPAVHSQTAKYNMKIRAGRGFTLEELREAGINPKEALTIGIAVDHRRKNRCIESLQTNVARLKEYRSKLVLFPRKAGKPKKGDAADSELATATQLTSSILPISRRPPLREVARKITDEDRATSAYHALRTARVNLRLVGPRHKKEQEKTKAM